MCWGCCSVILRACLAGIARWLDVSNRDPITNSSLQAPFLIQYRPLREQIEKWAGDNEYEIPVPEHYVRLSQRLQARTIMHADSSDGCHVWQCKLSVLSQVCATDA